MLNMSTFEKSDSTRDPIEIFQTLSGSSLNEKSVYDPSALSSLSRLNRYLVQGIVEVGSLSSFFQRLGLNECTKELEAESERHVQNARVFLQLYVDLLNEKIATLPLYFQKQYEHWERICGDDPEHAGHFTNNARIAEAIITRRGLAQLGIAHSFRESEFEEALPWLQKTIKLVTNAEIQNALHDGRDDIELKTGLQNLLDFLVNWCPNTDISPEELEFGSEDNKRKIEKMLVEHYREFLGNAANAAERLHKMTSQISAAVGLVMRIDSDGS
jgi:hypothetical protein